VRRTSHEQSFLFQNCHGHTAPHAIRYVQGKESRTWDVNYRRAFYDGDRVEHQGPGNFSRDGPRSDRAANSNHCLRVRAARKIELPHQRSANSQRAMKNLPVPEILQPRIMAPVLYYMTGLARRWHYIRRASRPRKRLTWRMGARGGGNGAGHGILKFTPGKWNAHFANKRLHSFYHPIFFTSLLS